MVEQNKNKKTSKGGVAKSEKTKEKSTKIPVVSDETKYSKIDLGDFRKVLASIDPRRSSRKSVKPETYKPPETKNKSKPMNMTAVMMYIKQIKNGELDVNDPSKQKIVNYLYDSLKKHMKLINESFKKCEEYKDYKEPFEYAIDMLDKTVKPEISVKASVTKRKKSPSPSQASQSQSESVKSVDNLIDRLSSLNTLATTPSSLPRKKRVLPKSLQASLK